MTSIRQTVGELLHQARGLLFDCSETPALEAQLLLGKVLSAERTWLLAHPEAEVAGDAAAHFEELIRHRLKGSPLPYLLGEWAFYGRSFIVSPAVLIPRPETEQLVEIARAHCAKRTHPPAILDVGTGSGCIAISLALAFPQADVTAVDVSPEALAVAVKNGQRHQANNIRWLQSDLLSGIPADRFPMDLICANLPYIPMETWAGLDVARAEPRLALDGGPDGLRLIESLLQQARGRIHPDGMILLEIENTQGQSASAAARRAFPQANVEVIKDLAGHDRLVVIHPPEEINGKNLNSG